MNCYEITLWVTLEQETAIFELFNNRKWIYTRTDAASESSYTYQKETSINSETNLLQPDYRPEVDRFDYQVNNEKVGLASRQIEMVGRKQETNNIKVVERPNDVEFIQITEHTGSFNKYFGRKNAACSSNSQFSATEIQDYDGSFKQGPKEDKHKNSKSGDSSCVHVSDYTAVQIKNGLDTKIQNHTLMGSSIHSAEDGLHPAINLNVTYEQSSDRIDSYLNSFAHDGPQNTKRQLDTETALCSNVENLKQLDDSTSITQILSNHIPVKSLRNDSQEYEPIEKVCEVLLLDESRLDKTNLNCKLNDTEMSTATKQASGVENICAKRINIYNDSTSEQNKGCTKKHLETMQETNIIKNNKDFIKGTKKEQSKDKLCQNNNELSSSIKHIRLRNNRVATRVSTKPETGFQVGILANTENMLHPINKTVDFSSNEYRKRSTTTSGNKSNVKLKKKIPLTKKARISKPGKKGDFNLELATDKPNEKLEGPRPFSGKRRKNTKHESSKESIKKESDKNKKVNIYCADCEHTFKYQKNYDKHLEEGKCKHVCEFCGKVFLCGLTGNYKIHMKYHLKEKNHVCNICGKSYIEYRKLKEHYRKHTGEEPYMCDECGLTFSGFGSLYSHKKNKHAAMREDYYCPQCPKVFKGYSGLTFHIKYYHQAESEKPFTCSKCNQSFRTPDILKRHETVHKETKDYKCDQCQASFKRIQGLTEHKKRHAKEYSYFCSYCGKGFYTRQATVVHERCHTGEKPYTCSLCSYSCALNGNLKKHMKTHNKLSLS